MDFFTKVPTKPTVKSIQEATDFALSGFRTAIKALQSANSEAATLFDENETKISKLIDSNDSLTLIQEDNEHVIMSISYLLSPKKEEE